jgi:hypothetical protein
VRLASVKALAVMGLRERSGPLTSLRGMYGRLVPAPMLRDGRKEGR